MRSGDIWLRYKLPSQVDVRTICENLSEMNAILDDSRHCLMDVSEVKFLDSTGLGSLTRLQQKLASRGRHFILLAPSPAVRRALRLVRLHEFIACACDVPTALQIIEARERERTAVAGRRTAAALNPLVWQGEITAANAETVWKLTRDHIHALCDAWRGPLNGNGHSSQQLNTARPAVRG